MSYAQKVMELFRNPKHSGKVVEPDGVGQVGNMKCGDMMKVTLKVKNNKIEKVRFETFGCVAAIASSEALCEIAEGKTIEEAEKITNQDIIDYMGEVPQIKVHCSVLGANALKAAIADYKKKKK